jgi:hypothetical protein
MMLASQDYAGIEQALPLLFQSAVAGSGRGSSSRVPNPESRITEAFAPWLAHLCELDAIADLAPAAGLKLTFPELKGLALLRRAREKFRGEHFACKCGAVLPNWAGWCGSCGEKFARPGRKGSE